MVASYRWGDFWLVSWCLCILGSFAQLHCSLSEQGGLETGIDQYWLQRGASGIYCILSSPEYRRSCRELSRVQTRKWTQMKRAETLSLTSTTCQTPRRVRRLCRKKSLAVFISFVIVVSVVSGNVVHEIV